MITSKGLENVIVAETDLSLVDGLKGQLVYRGHWAKDLALSHSFEEVAFLIWNKHLPSQDELAEFNQQLIESRSIPVHVKSIIDRIPKEISMTSVLRTAVSALEQPKLNWPPSIEQAIDLTAKIPTLIAYRYNRLLGNEPVEPRSDLGHTANYLYMLKGEEASPAQVRALDAYLILTQEHGLNASTFTARVVASTHSDLASAITAAIGALKGPLHGGAPSEVIEMFEQIGTKENAEAWLRTSLEQGKRLMGFGHRIYKTRDPRATALSQIAKEFSKVDPWFDFASHVEQAGLKLLGEYKPNRGLNTNVEFYAAVVMKSIGLTPELFTPTFALSRIVGWCAHVFEAANDRLIRPQSTYLGDMPTD